MLKFLLEKEFKQILRNKVVPAMMVMMPLMMVLLMPLAATFEITNLHISVVDNDHSSYSKRLIQEISSSKYFQLAGTENTYQNALHKQIETSKSDLILEIPKYFERDLIKHRSAKVGITANAVNGSKGSISASYLSGILQSFSSSLSNATIQTPPVKVSTQIRFNPTMNYKIFMIPAMMVILITMLCGMMPALNIVGEKEVGTIEQMNVTPVSKFQFIIAKLIPYWIIGFLSLSLSFLLAYFVYGLSPKGSLTALYTCTAIYTLIVSGLGLVVSNKTSTMQQAMLLAMFFLVIFMFLGGIFTPISSMPTWAQNLTYINPLRYFGEVMRMVYLKGSGFSDLFFQMGVLSLFAILSNTWAIKSYKKQS